ncbi:Putative AC9 transposase [Frankliniella fusca]|uniref:AC9 transposase n=1 Tax=Frankliniella fusca TaxID=407009 RepID=A0AAE1GVB1_9NEOP|nr:Putative AC9 transposase [Frankliniella fusca]
MGKSYLKKLWARIQQKTRATENNVEVITNEDTSSPDTPDPDTPESEDEVSAMIKARDIDRVSGQNSSDRDIGVSLESYYRSTPLLDRKKSVLKYWEENKVIMPVLYQLALIVHAIPATQVSVERLFSALKFILIPLRLKLSSQMIDDLLIIFNNSILMKEDVLAMISSLEPELGIL